MMFKRRYFGSAAHWQLGKRGGWHVSLRVGDARIISSQSLGGLHTPYS
jgi:hypothetical protein